MRYLWGFAFSKAAEVRGKNLSFRNEADPTLNLGSTTDWD